MPQPPGKQRSVLQQGTPGPPSLMAVARAQRIANGTTPFEEPSDLMLKELPDVGPRETPEWRDFQAKLAAEVAEADAGEGFEYVFYGDSITERWRGTEMDSPHPDGHACAESFKKHFDGYRTALLAISGDQTGHLLWRLDNGELPAAAHAPKAAILLIGTNDLGAANSQGRDPTEAAPDAVRRLTAIVGLLRARLPETHVLLAAVLPRGEKAADGTRHFKWPSKFAKGIQFINEHMATAAAGEANVTFVSCNKPFLAKGRVLKAIMPDALHPNAAGMDVLADCYRVALRRLGLMEAEQKKKIPQRLRRRWWRL